MSLTVVSQATDDDIRGFIRKISNQAHSELVLSVPELDITPLSPEETLLDVTEDEIWKEIPIPIEQFVNDSYHMGQPRLSMRQARAMNEFLGATPRRIFLSPETNYRIATLLWGKGAGKDWICTLLQCYVVYQLLCMRDPRRIITLAPDEPIDILNVAYSADQANRVYFTKFLNRVYNWPWLEDRYPIIQSGRIINKHKVPDVRPSKREHNYVQIGADMVTFPNGIRAISEHSESESYEGYNIVFWVMDEAAAFRDKGKKANAHRVFSTLRTSAHSRFPSLWRGVLISYPRSEDDFMMMMYRKAKKMMAGTDSVMYADKGDTWEINPTKHKAQFDSEKDLDPVDYECKYRCNPPPQEGAIFSPEAVDSLLNIERQPLFDAHTSVIPIDIIDPVNGSMIHKERIGKIVENIRIHTLTDKAIPRVFHVDAGLTTCPAALIIAHGEPAIVKLPNSAGEQEDHVVNKVVVDQCVVWMPNKSKNLTVSINNIASVIQELARECTIVRGSYDQWNSESSIEALMAAGIPVEKHDINAEDYGRMEVLINLNAIDIPMADACEWEILTQLGLKKVIQIGEGMRKKYTVGEGGYKDPVDALAGVCRLLNDPEVRGLVTGHAAPRLISGVPLTPAGSGMNPHSRTVKQSMSNPFLPDKMINRVAERQGGIIIQNIEETREKGITHRLISNLMPGSEAQVLSYKSPGTLGRVRPPSIIKSK